MGQRPATISQADLNRIFRAARKNGAKAVEVPLNGEVVRVVLGEGGNSGDKPPVKVAKKPVSIF